MPAAAGQLARSTGIEVQSFNMTAVSLTKVQVVALDGNGRAVLGTNSVGTVQSGKFIAIESVDNSAGANDDKQIRCAVGNTWIYATAAGAIKVGQAVKAAAAGEVQAATGIFAAETHLGRYFGHEGEEAVPTDAAANDIVIVRLGI